MKVVVTGGAGFIGSNLIRELLAESDWSIINCDCLTYAGNLANLNGIETGPRYKWHKVDLRDANKLYEMMDFEQPDAIIHLAAESHVDRSIDGPADFIHTNIVGTYHLLEAFRRVWVNKSPQEREQMRFLHVSTDEVFGSLGKQGYFTETTAYDPSSPYSASKASSDHLVRAWNRTYGLPTLISNCSNNYGPYQDLEKLIPLIIMNGLEGKALPVYGKGLQVRDWLFVRDHAKALHTILRRGAVGESYNIGGHNEWRNIDVVRTICQLLDDYAPMESGQRHEDLIEFVTDRPGHDLRYAIDASKVKKDLGWEPQVHFEQGLAETVRWYIDPQNPWSIAALKRPSKRDRLGLSNS